MHDFFRVSSQDKWNPTSFLEHRLRKNDLEIHQTEKLKQKLAYFLPKKKKKAANIMLDSQKNTTLSTEKKGSSFKQL